MSDEHGDNAPIEDALMVSDDDRDGAAADTSVEARIAAGIAAGMKVWQEAQAKKVAVVAAAAKTVADAAAAGTAIMRDEMQRQARAFLTPRMRGTDQHAVIRGRAADAEMGNAAPMASMDAMAAEIDAVGDGHDRVMQIVDAEVARRMHDFNLAQHVIGRQIISSAMEVATLTGKGRSAELRQWKRQIERRMGQAGLLTAEWEVQWREISATVSLEVDSWYNAEVRERARMSDAAALRIDSFEKLYAAMMVAYGAEYDGPQALVEFHEAKVLRVTDGEDLHDYFIRMSAFRERLNEAEVSDATFQSALLHHVARRWPEAARELTTVREEHYEKHGVIRTSTLHQMRAELITAHKRKGKLESKASGFSAAAASSPDAEVARLVKIALAAHHAKNGSRPKPKAKGEKRGHGDLNALDAEGPRPKRARISSELRRFLMDANRCFNCGEVGHRAADCSNPTKDLSGELSASSPAGPPRAVKSEKKKFRSSRN